MKNRIGIVGGGQLGRMLTLAAKKMGYFVTILDPTAGSPAGQVADQQIIATYSDRKALKILAEGSDFITFEIELADSTLLHELSKKNIRINPHPETLSLIKDKLAQKTFLRKIKIPVADFMEVDDNKDIEKAARVFGYPLLLKSRFDGYDGRGNFLVKQKSDIKKGITKLAGRKLYVEKLVPFIKEIAVMVARSGKNEVMSYPVVETIHKNNICHMVIAPAQIDSSIQKKAKTLAERVMKHLSGAGVFGIEMFVTKKDDVLINEIAPRVHNSGHYTIEACVTDQFEQHIRAITNLPLGSTSMKVKHAVMINVLGNRNGVADIKGLDKVLRVKDATAHIYGKMITRKERKMGHITVVDSSMLRALQKAKKARNSLSI